jgi:N-hydroxyarylamine O-acetyltransferase
VQDYLDRIGFSGPTAVDLDTLTALQRAHMSTVPFENIAVWQGEPVSTEVSWSIPKIVERGHGGWCFELNGAFAALLESLGFTVRRLAAAVLLDGPNQIVDHATLEVQLDEPFLVDVGFGESFTRPLRLNSREPQEGGIALFQFFDSAQGLTLTKLEPDTGGDANRRSESGSPPGGQSGSPSGTPVPQFRFRRVVHDMGDFAEASERLKADPSLRWSTKPFATRLIDGGPQRVTLLKDRLKYHGDGDTAETPVAKQEWEHTLTSLFRSA